jgi:hypothetical protein
LGHNADDDEQEVQRVAAINAGEAQFDERRRQSQTEQYHKRERTFATPGGCGESGKQASCRDYGADVQFDD